MNHTLLRYCALLLLMGIGVFGVRPAYAVITCTVSMSPLNFGSVDPQATATLSTATLNYSCNNTYGSVRKARVCLNIETPDGGSTTSRRMLDSSAHSLNFQLYRDSARSNIWGSQTPSAGAGGPIQLELAFAIGQTISGTETMYGRVAAGQTSVVPGNYTSVYSGIPDTRLTINASAASGSMPKTCNTNPQRQTSFNFSVSAAVVKKCTVTANPLDFGTNPGLLNTARDANTTLSVQCSNETPYNVGLDAGQNGGGDINTRKMVLGNGSVVYQLYRDPARTEVWGNTIGADTVDGDGTGITHNIDVYGRVLPQTTPPAGTYNDVVTVTVTY